jgi:predicted RNA-binding Zn-ribbon protein involved in translation (DUF1610 family)
MTATSQSTTAVNFLATRTGRVKAVCQCCGHQSPAKAPNDQGEPDLFRLPANWSEAPYFTTTQHSDGSHGSRYTCPACNAKLSRGQTLRMRAYLQPAVGATQ